MHFLNGKTELNKTSQASLLPALRMLDMLISRRGAGKAVFSNFMWPRTLLSTGLLEGPVSEELKGTKSAQVCLLC